MRLCSKIICYEFWSLFTQNCFRKFIISCQQVIQKWTKQWTWSVIINIDQNMWLQSDNTYITVIIINKVKLFVIQLMSYLHCYSFLNNTDRTLLWTSSQICQCQRITTLSAPSLTDYLRKGTMFSVTLKMKIHQQRKLYK